MQFDGRYVLNLWLHYVSYFAGFIMFHTVVELVFTGYCAWPAGNYQIKLCSSTRTLICM
jgi:hypothetical protein